MRRHVPGDLGLDEAGRLPDEFTGVDRHERGHVRGVGPPPDPLLPVLFGLGECLIVLLHKRQRAVPQRLQPQPPEPRPVGRLDPSHNLIHAGHRGHPFVSAPPNFGGG
jgi:hypothetical protein